MQAGFQIRTSMELTEALPYPTCSPSGRQGISFLSDSKVLNCSQTPRVLRSPVNGLGRAISEMPANLQVFHPEAARRDL